jgi:pyruvate ferredoxin oxidoreductase alpha subunit
MHVMEQELTALSGNEAVAYAFKQARPHVASVFPITPQTEMMHKFAEFVADGELATEMILVESEHSAMSAAVGYY